MNKIRYFEGHIDKAGKGHCQMSEMKNGHLQKCENEFRKRRKALLRTVYLLCGPVSWCWKHEGEEEEEHCASERPVFCF